MERNVAQLLLVDGDSVGHIVARVPREARRAFESNRETNSLDRRVHGGHVIRLGVRRKFVSKMGTLCDTRVHQEARRASRFTETLKLDKETRTSRHRETVARC